MFLLEVGNPADFAKYFAVEAAVDEAMKHEVYRVRHEVYCQNWATKPPTPTMRKPTVSTRTRCRSRCARRQAVASLVVCGSCSQTRTTLRNRSRSNTCARRQSTAASSTRPASTVGAWWRFHASRCCRITANVRATAAVRSPFQKRTWERGISPASLYIPVGLYLGLLAAAELHDIEHLFTLTEARLARHLSALGFRIHLIGQAEHRGKRGAAGSVIYRKAN